MNAGCVDCLCRGAKQIPVRWPAKKIVRRAINVNHPTAKPVGRINRRKVDATTDSDIAAHKAADEADASRDAAKFARRVRRRLRFSQADAGHLSER